MFNPDDFDEVCVQAIHIESGGRPFKFSSQSSKELEIKDSNDNKGKNNSKRKKLAIPQKERPTCSHCQRIIMMNLSVGNFIQNLSPKSSLRRRMKRRQLEQSSKI